MASDKLKRGIVKNSFWSFFVTVVNRIGVLLFAILLARYLMPEGYGVYSLVISIAMIFYTFSDLGINQALSKNISYYLIKDRKKAAAYYLYLVKLKFYLTLISSLLVIVLAYPLAYYVFKNPSLFILLIFASFYIFLLAFDSFYSQIFYLIEKVKYLGVWEIINQTCLVLGSLFVFYFVASRYQILSIIILLFITSLIWVIFSMIYFRKKMPYLLSKSETEIDKKSLLKFIGYLTIASLSTAFFSYVDSILLGLFVAPEYLGFYRAAFSLVLGLTGLLAFQNAVLLPLFSKRKKEISQKIFNQSFKYIAIVSIPCSFGILAFGSSFLKLFYGPAYLPAAASLYILSFLIFPSVSLGLFSSLFSAEGKPQIFARLIVITTIINIILNIVLIWSLLKISPEWAISGAAIAALLSWLFYFILAAYFLNKELGFSTPFKILIKPIICSLIMFSFLVYFKSVAVLSHGFLITGIFSAMILYFILLIIFKGIKKEDLQLIKILFS